MLALAFPDLAGMDARRARELEQAAAAASRWCAPTAKVLVDSEQRGRNGEPPARGRSWRRRSAAVVGWSIRRSATIGIDFLYVAVPVAGEPSA